MRKGSTHTPEARAKIKNNHAKCRPTLGKIYTDAERANISAGVKKAFAVNPMPRIVLARSVGVVAINKSRTRCKQLLRRVLKVTGTKKAVKTYEALGYTEKELIAHLESKFKPGMNWQDRESFHIDHIKPVSVLIAEGITDPKIINALSNLQPLYPDENRRKSDKYERSL